MTAEYTGTDIVANREAWATAGLERGCRQGGDDTEKPRVVCAIESAQARGDAPDSVRQAIFPSPLLCGYAPRAKGELWGSTTLKPIGRFKIELQRTLNILYV